MSLPVPRPSIEPLTLERARAFVAGVPWRAVRRRPYSWNPETRTLEDDPHGRPPDPHQYVVVEWREVDERDFDRFRELIARCGYPATYAAPYRPDFVMSNRYLELDGWCYWWMYPNTLNRERAARRKHTPIAPERAAVGA